MREQIDALRQRRREVLVAGTEAELAEVDAEIEALLRQTTAAPPTPREETEDHG